MALLHSVVNCSPDPIPAKDIDGNVVLDGSGNPVLVTLRPVAVVVEMTADEEAGHIASQAEAQARIDAEMVARDAAAEQRLADLAVLAGGDADKAAALARLLNLPA